MTKTFTRFAVAAAIAAAIAVPAAQASAATRGQNALIGAAVGALAGAALGHGDTGAVVAGAAVGGLVGASTGHDRYDRGRDYRGGYRTYGPQPTRYAPAYGWDRSAYRSYDRGYVPVSYRGYGY
jgi:hypothetical protein